MNRKIILSIATALASSQMALAAPQAPSPLAFAQSEANLSQTAQNYVNSGSKLSREDLKTLDAKLIQTYGNPTSIRGGLKIWEITNASASGGQSDFTTIMCGIDRDGSQVFVIDSRGAAQGDNPRLFESTSSLKTSGSKTSISPNFSQTSPRSTKVNDWD